MMGWEKFAIFSRYSIGRAR